MNSIIGRGLLPPLPPDVPTTNPVRTGGFGPYRPLPGGKFDCFDGGGFGVPNKRLLQWLYNLLIGGKLPFPPLPPPPPPDNGPIALKPAIYLYPERSTAVRVFIDPRVKLNIDIPKYNPQTGWYVQAEPDGSLRDLLPEQTSPEEMEKYNDVFGAKYAYASSISHLYPYLYWDGQAVESYNKIEQGWVVNTAQVMEFLQDKLYCMGLNAQEISDFTEYWVHKLTNLEFDWFKLAFFFTEDFDAYHPMKITPQPDTIYRMMMCVTPLLSEPKEHPQPQIIHSLGDRVGFTVVEWGGYFEPVAQFEPESLKDVQEQVLITSAS